MGQLAKQLAEKSIGNFMANSKKNPKEECTMVLTRRKRKENLEKTRVEGKMEDVSEEEVEDERREKEADNKETELRDEISFYYRYYEKIRKIIIR